MSPALPHTGGNSAYREGVVGAAIWYALGILYFAVKGRHQLVRSPEEQFAIRAERS